MHTCGYAGRSGELHAASATGSWTAASEPCRYSHANTVRSVIQNDDADQQNPGSSSRDMQSDGCVLIKGCDVATHRGFETKPVRRGIAQGASGCTHDRIR